ncbi:MAG: hypothetical protein ABSA68_13950 [Xanthobacteraceae bacterium]|jgi:hypothetical protein
MNHHLLQRSCEGIGDDANPGQDFNDPVKQAKRSRENVKGETGKDHADHKDRDHDADENKDAACGAVIG